ncbi:hypothetical protein LSAT2_018286, partial [Lamellibrachia satsuma]
CSVGVTGPAYVSHSICHTRLNINRDTSARLTLFDIRRCSVERSPVSIEIKQLKQMTECSVALSIPELIQKKRDGERLSAETIRLFVSGAVSGDMQDSQI